MTRVLVVDDSQFMRTVIGNALSEAGYDVETATNGVEAVETVASFDPAVVTMDVEMPEMGGIEAVERIMTSNPTPILMLSAYTSEGADATLDAIERGAVDCLEKPDGSGSRNIAHLATEVVETVDELADADVSSLALARASATAHSTETHAQRTASAGTATADPQPNSSPTAGPVSPGSSGAETPDSGPGIEPQMGADRIQSRPVDPEEAADDPTVVIGASTGGPQIVERLLERLPIELGAKVLVVQHMPADFTDRFADRLDARSDYDVREPTDGDRIRAGEAAVAPGGYHLEVTTNVGGAVRVRLDDGERVHGVRPAIDVTMETAASKVDDPLCGVVLTGMGNDGAAGIEAIKTAGGHTIAQNEATSPVFGIPCQAIETGCVDRIAPDTEIVSAIVDAFTGGGDGKTDD
ncbi:chemotaxis-specific protein-glutamate methyltransferase CheB [Halopiger djelfimassiliensis]|uniref:chemotaxis-specific protein-glutamate methyltransferase CheB n=1 Tax=Halopiger djelfimassiliensis TaxID=1293047 RepID=UPI0006776CEA|nr:chemotaxis-specific protein-glutamate methyltransferase CheB [Halopiger djelfimassiliensis]